MNQKIIIEIAKFSPYKMAFILINQKVIYSGNYWDFHSGCQCLNIAGYNLNGLWNTGIDSLAQALSKVIETKGQESEIKKKNLSKEEYNQLMGC